MANLFRVQYQYWKHSARAESFYCLALLDMLIEEMCCMLKEQDFPFIKEVFIDYITKCDCTQENVLGVN
jgi:hypothetical protein